MMRRGGTIGAWALSLAAGLYPGALLAPAIPLRERADGMGWILLILGATWACDTAAYFVGRRWGRWKLAPTVSPGKTRKRVAAKTVVSMATAPPASRRSAVPVGVPAPVVMLRGERQLERWVVPNDYPEPVRQS